MLSTWESLTPPGQDTNPSQVSSQQTLVLIYLPGKEGKLNWLRWKRRSHKYSNFGRAGIELGTLWLPESRDLTNCANHARPFTIKACCYSKSNRSSPTGDASEVPLFIYLFFYTTLLINRGNIAKQWNTFLKCIGICASSNGRKGKCFRLEWFCFIFKVIKNIFS